MNFVILGRGTDTFAPIDFFVSILGADLVLICRVDQLGIIEIKCDGNAIFVGWLSMLIIENN